MYRYGRSHAENTAELKTSVKTAKPKRGDKEAKLAGMKATFHTAVKTTDPDLKAAYCKWVDFYGRRAVLQIHQSSS